MKPKIKKSSVPHAMNEVKTSREGGEFHKTILDAFPSPVFIVDQDMRIIDLNAAGARLVGEGKTSVLRRKGGEVLQCIHSKEIFKESHRKRSYCPFRQSP